MSDFETVALIVIFLVLSAIIVRLIGGDADIEPKSRQSKQSSKPLTDVVAAPAASSAQSQRPTDPVPISRIEPAKPQPIEPAMVKVDLPPPTQLPDQRIAPQQAAAQVAQRVTPTAAEALAAVRAAAPAATQAPVAAQPVKPVQQVAPAPSPTTVTVTRLPDPPAKAADQPHAVTAAPQAAAQSAVVRPSAAATISPVLSAAAEKSKAPSPAPVQPPQQSIQASEQSAPPKPDVAAKPDVRPAEPRVADVSAAPSTNTGEIVVRPDVKATLAPDAMPTTTAEPWVAPRQTLSAEDQAIVSGYLRPDVKATLFRDPPPGWTPPAAIAPRPVEPERSEPRPALVAPAPTGPLVISQATAASTLPPGYQSPASQPKAGPVGPSTGFAPLGVKPDARATTNPQTVSALASAEPISVAAQSADVGSPRAMRAASIPPSTAVEQPAAAETVSQTSAPSATTEPALLSTAKRGTRVIGADAANGDLIELERPAAARSPSASIWSNTVPRRAMTDSEILAAEMLATPLSIRAERIPVRAETLLVRPDALRTIDPSAPKYSSIPKPPPVASVRPQAPAQAETGNRANVRFTLPPGALGDE